MLLFSIIKTKKHSAIEVFNICADFLLYFNKFGINYKKASVLICLLLPLIIYAILLILVYLKLK